MTEIRKERIRLVVSDLDGTILAGAAVLSSYCIETIKKLKDKGIGFCLATGRCEFDCIDALADAPFLSFLYLNGSVVKTEGKMLHSTLIKREKIERILDLIQRDRLITGFYDDHNVLSLPEKDISFKEMLRELLPQIGMDICNLDNERKTVSQKEILDTPIYKVEIQLTDGRDIDHYTKMFKELGLEVSHSGNETLEITALGVDKSTGLQFLQEYYGLNKEQIIVCGDSSNDEPLFKEYPLSIAPANGSKKIKEMAFRVGESAREDGIMKLLREMLLES